MRFGLFVLIIVLAGCCCIVPQPTTPEQPQITSLSTFSSMPVSLLEVSGDGFGSTIQNLYLRFYDGNGYVVDIPAISASNTSAIFSVPAFVNVSSGELTTGTVSVQVIRTSADGEAVSNVVDGFEIQAPPVPKTPAGAITFAFLNASAERALELKTEIIGTDLDNSEMSDALDVQASNLQSLASKVQAVVDDPSKTFVIATKSGEDIIIDSKALLDSDRMLMAMLKAQSEGGLDNLDLTAMPHKNVNTAHLQGTVSLESAELQSSSGSGCMQTEARNLYDAISTDENMDQQKFRAYLGAPSTPPCQAAEAFNKGYLIVGGASAVATGLLVLAGAPAMAVAIPAAIMLYTTVVGAGGLIAVGGTLGQTTDGAMELVKTGVEKLEDQATGFIRNLFLPDAAGAAVDIYQGQEDIRKALTGNSGNQNPAPILPAPPGVTPTNLMFNISLTVAGDGDGQIYAEPYSDDDSYSNGTVVTLTAEADSSSEFVGWSGACIGSSDCVLIMTENKEVQAEFKKKQTPTPPPTPGLNGDIAVKIDSGACGNVRGRAKGPVGTTLSVYQDNGGTPASSVNCGSWTRGPDTQYQCQRMGNNPETTSWSANAGGHVVATTYPPTDSASVMQYIDYITNPPSASGNYPCN